MTDYRRLRVALLGAGAVGSQVAALLLKHGDELADRAGAALDLVGISVRDIDAPRDVELPRELLTTDPEPLLVGSDIVIELMGGIEPARTSILQAIGAGADIVTANKALLATHGPELFEAADQVGASIYYEAAAAGAIPIIRPLRDSLAGDRVQRIMGIVNGTTNYILDRMDREGSDFADVLADAQALGYAEADPTADVEGYDAAQKAAILASLAFHTAVPLNAVHREGITQIDADMMDAARKAGYVIKLLAVCERLADAEVSPSGETISVRVYPALVPREHPLASVHGANNAVFVQAEAAGDLMFYGAGAGGVQTASAVLGDVVSAARRHIAGGVGVGESTRANLPVVPIGHVTTRYQITLEVDDRSGVLAAVAGLLSDGNVSVATLEQTIVADGDVQTARLVIGTHTAREQDLSDAVASLGESGVVKRVVSVLRVEGD
ncbi:homoserine dehydrogenase [Microbacterium sp. AISO3]|jgi:homoserine dehydrogenase|uniref:Homoserine dehydrogenase n=1 Tax=Microbacterium paludicola TaxID=300019 RepID=A0ABU1I1J0_9MICO|nr:MULTISPECIES: homoserine dehydrogenase [Microbacterium]APF35457.1 homoserine dehydrogenase [Microbacterium paludicola]MDR6167028.1 homoserine dehydrogenase [Microbacterium paludicola]OWP22606.1 homoserine dehydrogenase [Microbacterium sp. AISO3]POX66376.1 homoserine dehydrogenase [Microbacterium sp. Ru50]QCR40973.1 homoserine dehydrogenase [Microbacterium sp. SGAir0570]